MFPSFIKRYWIGLVANATRANTHTFRWTDPSVLAPSTATYLHWGRVLPSNTVLQPDNFNGTENCAVANYTESYLDAFGWSDCLCNITAPFMCRVSRESRCKCDMLAQLS